jgi:alkyl sulfatase BDS1-like metallo-beta-lactamase superfamily hydrolase
MENRGSDHMGPKELNVRRTCLVNGTRSFVLALWVVVLGVGPLALAGGIARGDTAQEPAAHFHPKGQPPSRHTVQARQRQRLSLPFDDQRDVEEAQRGFIAAPPYRQIVAEAGNVAWDMGSYDWLLEGRDFDSVHPSLQRQAMLNMAYGLYEVVPGRIYQVRGFDLANMSFIKGDTGWIVFDVLTARETAAAALALANAQLGERPVVAVVYSHSHADHFGGVRGVVDEADVRSGKVPIIAPAGFMEHAVAENVHAGNAMTRRLFYQYGILLPHDPFGHVDQAIGKNVAVGNLGLIAPTRVIEGDIEELTIDGVTMVFQNTPGTEAPAEMNTWFPQFKAFWAAENITGTIHNIYTLRGALVRDPLEWSKKINEALYRFGRDAEVMFSAHNWPRWGNDRIQEVMRAQRDLYAHLNNEVLHLANQGVTINEIHNVYRPPASLRGQWAAHSYHGSEAHNSRAVINRYLGYWDANPATLIPLSPGDAAPLYVEMMGGAARIVAKGRELYEEGRYLHAQEILDKLVYAEPDNQEAKDLLADVWEQIGYQQESSSVRNSFLAGALELRSGIPSGAAPKSTSPDLIRAMSTELWLEYLAVLLDSRKAEGERFTINLVTPDNGERFAVELSNSVLTSIQGQLVDDPDLTVTIDRSDLETVMMQRATFEQQVASGKATLTGDASVLGRLLGMLTVFQPDFEILPGTKRPAAAAGQRPEARSLVGAAGES